MVKKSKAQSGRQKVGPDLRPLTGRALKSVVDTLRPYFPGTKVLDLYSGLGRFGLAALSQKANSVTFVEKERNLVRRLKEETEALETRRNLFAEDVFSFTKKAANQGTKYDIIFADPPYRLWNVPFNDRLFRAVIGLLVPEAIFLVRYPKKVLISFPSESFSHWKTSDFGDSQILYLRSHGNIQTNV